MERIVDSYIARRKAEVLAVQRRDVGSAVGGVA
jgi:hypothetical protein